MRNLVDNKQQKDKESISRQKSRLDQIEKNKEFNLPFKLWSEQITAKLKYKKLIQEEAKRKRKDKNYKVRVKIGKKNRHLFE